MSALKRVFDPGKRTMMFLFLLVAPLWLFAHDESRLYLVEFEATEAGAPTSREQAIELLEQSVVPSLEKLANEGTIRAGGLFAGARAGAFIVSAQSHEEVTRLVRALPAWGVWRWEVSPLESFAHRVRLERSEVERLRRADR